MIANDEPFHLRLVAVRACVGSREVKMTGLRAAITASI